MLLITLFQDRAGRVNGDQENVGLRPGAGLMLAQRLRRWANISPAPGPRLRKRGR